MGYTRRKYIPMSSNVIYPMLSNVTDLMVAIRYISNGYLFYVI